MSEFKHRYCKNQEELDALWGAIQHWADLATGLETIASSDQCPLCLLRDSKWDPERMLLHVACVEFCPIARATGAPFCLTTPYAEACDEDGEVLVPEDAVPEYQFLVALALEEDIDSFRRDRARSLVDRYREEIADHYRLNT